MLFVVTAIDKKDSLALRMSVREQHFAFIRDTGCLKIGGPYLNEKGEMCGSLIIFEAADLEAAKAWHAQDPYVKAGLFETSDLRPWKLTANPIEAKF